MVNSIKLFFVALQIKPIFFRNEYGNHDSSVNSVSWASSEYGLILACRSSDGSISILTCNTEYGTWDYKKISNAVVVMPLAGVHQQFLRQHLTKKLDVIQLLNESHLEDVTIVCIMLPGSPLLFGAAIICPIGRLIYFIHLTMLSGM